MIKLNLDQLRYDYHGGDNCGITHIHYFQDYGGKILDFEEAVKELKKSIEENCNNSYTYGGEYLYEITLNSCQFDALEKLVLGAGFQKVTTFTNGNSGNVVCVYHLIHTRKGSTIEECDEEPLEYDWDEEE